MTQIVFLNTPNPATKIERLVATINDHFQRGERSLVLVPNVEAAQFVDALLWKTPEESFIPHQIVHTMTETPIAISQTAQNHNQATVLINLQVEVPNNWNAFATVYELMDGTHPQKLELAQRRLQRYKDLGANVKLVTN